MKSRGGTLIGAGSLDAPTFVAQTWAGGHDRSGRARSALAAGPVGALRGGERARRDVRAGERGVRVGGGGGLARDIYVPLTRHAPWHGTATPRWVVRQALPHLRSAILVVSTSAPCRVTMYGAAQAFGRSMAIGAAKSVS